MYDYETSARVGVVACCVHTNTERMPKDVYGEAERLMFEGRTLRAPHDWKQYLTQIYGDYLKLPPEEKRRFVRHAFRYWEIIRSRIPPQTDAIVGAMRESGQFAVVAGRIRDLEETDSGLEVRYSVRGATKVDVEKAALVINCVGPETDYDRIEQVLVRNLMRRHAIRRGPASIGIDAHPSGAVIGRDETSSSGVLYTLGSTMRGVLWEVLAVPDIRVQAQRLAEMLLDNHAKEDDRLPPWLPLAKGGRCSRSGVR
jgi:uncharacterized NAD(P)/FAD-binding protein YdhS